MLSSNEIQLLVDIYDGEKDKSFILLIDEIIYYDGWSSYEEGGWLLAFKAVDGTCHYQEHASSVFSSDNLCYFNPFEYDLDYIKKIIDQYQSSLGYYRD